MSVSEAGDYFQVLFEEDEDNPEADYLLLQHEYSLSGTKIIRYPIVEVLLFLGPT